MRVRVVQRTERSFSFAPARFSLGRFVSKIIGFFIKKGLAIELANLSNGGSGNPPARPNV